MSGCVTHFSCPHFVWHIQFCYDFQRARVKGCWCNVSKGGANGISRAVGVCYVVALGPCSCRAEPFEYLIKLVTLDVTSIPSRLRLRPMAGQTCIRNLIVKGLLLLKVGKLWCSCHAMSSCSGSAWQKHAYPKAGFSQMYRSARKIHMRQLPMNALETICCLSNAQKMLETPQTFSFLYPFGKVPPVPWLGSCFPCVCWSLLRGGGRLDYLGRPWLCHAFWSRGATKA